MTQPISSNKVATDSGHLMLSFCSRAGSRALSQHSLQTVPFTPATRQPQQCWTTPSTEDLRLDFTCENNTVS